MLTESSKRAKKPTLQAEIAAPNVRHLHRTFNSAQPWVSVYMCCVYTVCVRISVYMDAHTHNRYSGNQNKWHHYKGDRVLKHSFTKKKQNRKTNSIAGMEIELFPEHGLPSPVYLSCFLFCLSGRHVLHHFCLRQVPNITLGTLPPQGMEYGQHPQPLLVPCDWAISSSNLASLKAMLQLTLILLKNLVLLPDPSMLSSSW